MKSRFVVIGALSALVLALPAAAQKGGDVELGVFGQFDHMDTPWALKNGFGFGGRAGVFLTPRWELDADVATSSLTARPPRIGTGSVQYTTYAARAVYNIPHLDNQFLLELGVGGESADGGQDFVLSPGLGYRWNFNKTVSLRADGLVEYAENPANSHFDFPTAPVTVNKSAARSTNVELRVGLGFRIGNEPPPPPPPAPAPPPPAPAPAPAPPPPAPKPTINQDSIDAANRAAADAAARARATLEIKIYFDFDKSALRDDSKATLDQKVPILQANPAVRIRVEGNADERGSDEYNQALGMRRAQEARQYLIDKGINASRIDIISNGEEKPVCTDHNEGCWQQNRRDEFVIVAGGDSIKPAM